MALSSTSLGTNGANRSLSNLETTLIGKDLNFKTPGTAKKFFFADYSGAPGHTTLWTFSAPGETDFSFTSGPTTGDFIGDVTIIKNMFNALPEVIERGYSASDFPGGAQHHWMFQGPLGVDFNVTFEEQNGNGGIYNYISPTIEVIPGLPLYKVKGVAVPTDDNDAATKKYVDEATAGGGDVVGPASSYDEGIAVFDGTTGKILKGGGYIKINPTTGFMTFYGGGMRVNSSGFDIGAPGEGFGFVHADHFIAGQSVKTQFLEDPTSGVATVSTSGGLNDTNGNSSIDWEYRQAYDGTNVETAIDWNVRKLYNSAGVEVMNWASATAPPTFTGGASGSFTTADGKTVTVAGGLITSIV